ncbi:FtsX-like permease family protein [Bacillus sp. FSL W8-0519]|uniref:FtsX-like permease family protein n=1 Tax=Bacillus TaxID=1386 RepID=UPI001E2954E5|nr:FtsX-like permease family protein [Bacillus paranthracis]MCC2413248.1 FtsX-like permease family protein [Bacillus paranthracis]
MLLKLSMSGLKSKIRDYIVLLIGLVMSISIFYMFQTLAMNDSFIKANSMISSIGIIFQVGSFLLATITFFYILYANSFLLSLRQKEFGMYMMLGAKKYKITLLMFMETLAIGITSLIIGIGIGIGLSKGIGQLLMKELEFASDGYHALYIPSIRVTVIFFFILFFLAAIMNIAKLSRITILQLVHSEMKIDKPSVKGIKTFFVAVIGAGSLAIGYAALINIKALSLAGFPIATVATTLGTYLIFISLLPLTIKLLKKIKPLNEKGLNSFTFSQLSFRVNDLTKVLATVAMLIALAVGAIAGGMAFKNNISLTTDIASLYDVSVHNPTADEKKILNKIKFEEKANYRYKVDQKFVYYLKEDLEKNRPLVQNGFGQKKVGQVERTANELPVGAIVKKGANDTIGGLALSEEWKNAFKEIQPEYLYKQQHIKIADQKMYNQIKTKEQYVVIGKTNDFAAYKKEWKELDQLQLAKYKHITKDQLNSKFSFYEIMYTFTSGTVFMGFFLGIAFLAMMASCLMFKILSGATKDTKRYQMLRKIGVRRELLARSIYKELLLVFLFPATIGISHVIVGMNMFSFILIDPYFRIWVPLVIFAVIYTIYYLITVQLYKGIVLPKER